MAEKHYTIEKHDSLPIMMTKFHDDFVFGEDALSYSAEVKAFLDGLSSPVYYLFDLTHWNVMSFDEVMKASAQAARGKDSNFHHPKNRYTLIVTHDTLIGMSAEGMTSDIYGNAKVKVFNSIEDAMNFVKSDM